MSLPLARENKIYNSYWARFLVDTVLNSRYSLVVKAGHEYQVSGQDLKKALKTGTINVVGYDVPIYKLEFFRVSKRTEFDVVPFDPSMLKGKKHG